MNQSTTIPKPDRLNHFSPAGLVVWLCVSPFVIAFCLYATHILVNTYDRHPPWWFVAGGRLASLTAILLLMPYCYQIQIVIASVFARRLPESTLIRDPDLRDSSAFQALYPAITWAQLSLLLIRMASIAAPFILVVAWGYNALLVTLAYCLCCCAFEIMAALAGRNSSIARLRAQMIQDGIPVCVTCGAELESPLAPRCSLCGAEADPAIESKFRERQARRRLSLAAVEVVDESAQAVSRGEAIENQKQRRPVESGFRRYGSTLVLVVMIVALLLRSAFGHTETLILAGLIILIILVKFLLPLIQRFSAAIDSRECHELRFVTDQKQRAHYLQKARMMHYVSTGYSSHLYILAFVIVAGLATGLESRYTIYWAPIWIAFNIKISFGVYKKIRRTIRALMAQDGYLICVPCGYDLRGLPENAACPECGEQQG